MENIEYQSPSTTYTTPLVTTAYSTPWVTSYITDNGTDDFTAFASSTTSEPEEALENQDTDCHPAHYQGITKRVCVDIFMPI